ncbi:hypothetical protein LPJ61_005773, partial [Coemansia biformis]
MYGTVYVHYVASGAGAGVDDRYNHSGRYTTEDGTVSANVDLVAASDCLNAVKRVVVDVNYTSDPLPGLRAVTERLRAVAGTWHRVRALELSMRSSVSRLHRHSADAAEHMGDIEKVGNALSAIFPGLRELKLGETSNNRITRALYEQLVGHYANQLMVLYSKHPVTVPYGRQLEQIKVVAIDGDDFPGYQLPRMRPDNIESMLLKWLPASHSWAAFRADGDSQAIEFPRLRRLGVSYSGPNKTNVVVGQHLDDGPRALQFPALRHLAIENPQTVCPLLKHAVFPSRLESIEIVASTAMLEQVASIALPETRSLAIHIPSQARGGASALPNAKRILDRAGGCKKKELVVGDTSLQVPPEDIAGTGLTRLVVAAPTCVDSMFGFIDTHPDLDSLTLSNLALDEIVSDISIPESGARALMAPLDTRIRTLSFKIRRQLYSPDLAIPVAKYLLLRIPTLAEFFAPEIPRRPIVDFISEHVQR